MVYKSIKIMPLPSRVIVAGASAGGLDALTELVTGLTGELDASVFIVMHLSRTAVTDFLVLRLQPYTTMVCEVAKDGIAIERGHIYIAAAGFHLIVQNSRVILGWGPDENKWKPAINVLFRTAAVHWTNRVIGIILTGMLDDGATGMVAIKKSGGTCIIQDPNEAEYPDMPLAALELIEADYCLPVAGIAHIIKTLVEATVPEKTAAPPDLVAEAAIAEKIVIGFDNVQQLGIESHLACPDCGGGLWAIKDAGDKTRYRCHIGHAYSEVDLALRQNEVLQSTLWIALRMMEERRTLLLKMATDYNRRGFIKVASGFEVKAKELEVHIDNLKNLVLATDQAQAE